MGLIFKISVGFFAALWLSGCGGFTALTINSAPLQVTQTPIVVQTLSVTLTPTSSPTMTSTPIPIKPANQRPPASATTTVALPVVLGTPFPTPDEPITAGSVSRLRELTVFGWPAIYEAVLSADGKRLFLAASNGIEIYDTQTDRLSDRLDLIVQDNPLPGDLAVSTDGSVVLAVTRADVQVVDAKDGRVLWQYPQRLSSYGSVALSPDGRLVGVADCTNLEVCSFQVFQVGDGLLVFSGKGNRPLFSPDGRWFEDDVERSVWIWDTTTWSKVQSIWLENPAETTRTFSSDGELLAVGRSESVEIWRIAERKVIRAIGGLEPMEYDGVSVVFAPDSTQIAVQNANHQWQIFEITSGKRLQTIDLPQPSLPYWNGGQLTGYPVPERPNYFPAWNAKAFRFVDQDRALAFPFFREAETGAVKSEVCRLSLVGELVCKPIEESLAGIDLKSLARQVGSGRPIQPVAVLQNGNYLLYDTSVKFGEKAGLWDVETRRARTWNGTLTQWSASKDESRVAVGLRNNGVYHVEVVDLVSGKSIYRKDFKTFWLVLDLSLDGRSLAVVSDTEGTNQLQVIDLDAGKVASGLEIPTPEDGNVFVSAVEYGPAGGMLALAFSDGRIDVYNPEGKLLHTWQAHQGEMALAFSLDGRLLATSSRDGLIKIWEIRP